MLTNRAHRARLYPTPEQAETLTRWVGAARFLWNLAHDQRRWFASRRRIGAISQSMELPELRQEVPWLADLPAQVGQQVLHDLDNAFQRCGLGLSRYPLLKRKGQSVGLRFPQSVEVRRVNKRWGAVRLRKLGWVRFRWTRDLTGAIRHATILYKTGVSHIAFCLETEEPPSPPNGNPVVGVDRGVAIAFMTSDGVAFDRAMWTPKERERLIRLQRLKAKQVKGSNRYVRTSLAISRLHHRATDRRWDFTHKVSTHLAKNHGLVAVEALAILNLTKSAKGTVDKPGRNVRQKAGLNRAILDKGWGRTIRHLRYKCPWYGSQLVEVPSMNSSLECPKCGHIHPLNRPMQAVFICVKCGHADHADANAGVIIRERGIKLASAGGYSVAGRKESKRLLTWRQLSPRAVA